MQALPYQNLSKLKNNDESNVFLNFKNYAEVIRK